MTWIGGTSKRIRDIAVIIASGDEPDKVGFAFTLLMHGVPCVRGPGLGCL